jgi:hypothetical protein
VVDVGDTEDEVEEELVDIEELVDTVELVDVDELVDVVELLPDTRPK